jgi:hypothetical protein
MYRWISAHIVCVNADEVTQTVRHEHRTDVCIEHCLHIPSQDASSNQILFVDIAFEASEGSLYFVSFFKSTNVTTYIQAR